MADQLRVSLRLTAEDLMSEQIVNALTKLQLLEQATARVNNGPAVGGASRLAEAEAAAAEKGGMLTGALNRVGEAGSRMGEEFLRGAAGMAASLISFEAVVETVRKVTEAAREAEVANRQLGARFGEAAGEYGEFSEQVAQGTNFTAIQFEKAASALQPLTRDYGLSNEQLKDLLRTTADLAAANGVGLVQASNDVAATMRGQTRAGAELGLNLRANVIQGLSGLTEAEKDAALGGDTQSAAMARLKIINIDAAGALGMAAKAAGEGGDQFARMDKATANLWETLAKAPVFQSLAADLGTAATSAANLVLIMERIKQLDDESRAAGGGGNTAWNVGGGFLEGAIPGLNALKQAMDLYGRLESWRELGMLTYQASQMTSAQATGLSNTKNLLAGGSSGVPPQDWRTAPGSVGGIGGAASIAAAMQSPATQMYLYARSQLADYDESVKEVAQDGADLFTRHTAGWADVGSAITAASQKVGMFQLALKDLQSAGSVIGGELSGLVEDRALRRKAGLPELPGETAAIRDLYRRQYENRFKTGEQQLEEYRAQLERETTGGQFASDRVSVDRQEVDANTVIINGQVVGAGGVATGDAVNISGVGGSRVPDRYDMTRYTRPWVPGVADRR